MLANVCDMGFKTKDKERDSDVKGNGNNAKERCNDVKENGSGGSSKQTLFCAGSFPSI